MIRTGAVLILMAALFSDVVVRAGDTPKDAKAIAVGAYVYGYPLVTMEMTRRVMTNVNAPNGKFAPMGQFAHLRAYPSPDDKEVTAPNADTLYSLAWLNLTDAAYVLNLPDAEERFYLMPMLSGWTDVFQVPGTRTTGTKAQTYVITGPGWKGKLPEGATQLKSPTALVWILGRTYCDGTPEDYARVHAFQDKIVLSELDLNGRRSSRTPALVDPSVDAKTPIRDQVNAMTGEAYFTLLAKLLKQNPPAPADAPIVARVRTIGIVPGEDFDASKLAPDVAKAIEAAPAEGFKAILAQEPRAGTDVNGWTFSLRTGIYGTDYLQRALITAIGLGANRPQDAVYPKTGVDDERKPLDGKNRYVVHFDKGQTPPVNAFWSITMYDPAYFFVPNSLHRFSISARNALKTNADGSIDLLIQNESPGKDKESNWLPAPKGEFQLMLRLYWPKEAVLDGTWKPPVVTKAR